MVKLSHVFINVCYIGIFLKQQMSLTLLCLRMPKTVTLCVYGFFSPQLYLTSDLKSFQKVDDVSPSIIY